MYDSVNSYLNSVQRAWSAQDGKSVAALLSLKDKHVSNRSLQMEMPENMVERMLDPPIDEIVSAHLRVLYYLTCERNLILVEKMLTIFLNPIDFQLEIIWPLIKIKHCVQRRSLRF